jgi:hypothetical protein
MKTQVTPSARRRIAPLLAALLVASSLVACGGGGSGNQVVDKAGLALYTSAPATVSVPSGQSATYAVGGGGAGSQFVSYKASSSDPRIATAAIDGTKLVITAVGVGTAAINVTDSAGADVVVNVTVGGVSIQKLQLGAPATVTLDPGVTQQYKINGGAGPYTAVSSNPRVVATAAGTDSVIVTAANPGSATVIVYDNTGASSSFSITVGGASDGAQLYTTAPSFINLGQNSKASFQIAGGSGPYTVVSNSPDIATAAVDGTTLTLQTLSQAGKAQIDIVDAKGTRVSVIANVGGTSTALLSTTAPSILSIGTAPSPTYQIIGGVGPYTVSSSNPAVAKADVNGSSLVITGLSSGTAQIVVFDSTGAASMSAVAVGGGVTQVPLYTTAPDSITVLVGAKPTYTIAGGAAPFVVSSSDVTVATVSMSGNSFTVTGVSAGMATVQVHDANGTPVQVLVTVK